jgi:hypothetical protein
MVRGTGAASYTYSATVYTTSGIRAHSTRPTRPEGAPGLIPSPAQPSPAQAFCTACGEHCFRVAGQLPLPPTVPLAKLTGTHKRRPSNVIYRGHTWQEEMNSRGMSRPPRKVLDRSQRRSPNTGGRADEISISHVDILSNLLLAEPAYVHDWPCQKGPANPAFLPTTPKPIWRMPPPTILLPS